MMMTVMRSPPERSFLSSAGTYKCHDELKHSASFITAVREVPVVSPGNGKHANEVKRHANRDSHPGNSCYEYEQAHQVHSGEHHCTDDIGNAGLLRGGIYGHSNTV
jgi:hypothetical protein